MYRPFVDTCSGYVGADVGCGCIPTPQSTSTPPAVYCVTDPRGTVVGPVMISGGGGGGGGGGVTGTSVQLVRQSPTITADVVTYHQRLRRSGMGDLSRDG